jgi:hypothetical protein
MFYILNQNKETVPCDLDTWVRFFEKSDRFIVNDMINDRYVSTVFLGIDHNYFGGTPILFETMIFDKGSDFDCWCQRSCTYEEALLTHELALNVAKGGEIE